MKARKWFLVKNTSKSLNQATKKCKNWSLLPIKKKGAIFTIKAPALKVLNAHLVIVSFLMLQRYYFILCRKYVNFFLPIHATKGRTAHTHTTPNVTLANSSTFNSIAVWEVNAGSLTRKLILILKKSF